MRAPGMSMHRLPYLYGQYLLQHFTFIITSSLRWSDYYVIN